MTDTHLSPVTELDRLLDEERDALTGGRLAALEPLLERKAQLIDALRNEASEAPDRIAPLQIKLKRNRELFEQALDGLRSVSERLEALREVRNGGATYDGRGQKLTLDAAPRGRMEKRA
ncbi:flagellar protein FlgN [Roseivivax sediminis]|uniref:FlgN protein n=1 Tax=Roseivivax sediminis TaxID=936889 RepID=A0A1I1U7Z3_9RHOB|nr:flagellar protein FlgN [Roseivivax sediminis]SFD66897.1 hypothetical protein SAMN04515678_102201 [Roseivivax sediminis]